MKRRTRPLDTSEYRTVSATTPLDLKPVADIDDYALRWPDAPLSRLCAKASAPRPVVLVPVVSKDNPENILVMPPRDAAPAAAELGKRVEIGPLMNAALVSAGVNVALPGSSTPGASSSDKKAAPNKRSRNLETTPSRALVAVEEELAELEIRAFTAAATHSGPLQQLLTLQSLVAKLTDGPSEAAGLPAGAVYRAWLLARVSTATAARPWGTPLAPAQWRHADADEFFILAGDTSAPSRGKGGSKAGGSAVDILHFTPLTAAHFKRQQRAIGDVSPRKATNRARGGARADTDDAAADAVFAITASTSYKAVLDHLYPMANVEEMAKQPLRRDNIAAADVSSHLLDHAYKWFAEAQ